MRFLLPLLCLAVLLSACGGQNNTGPQDIALLGPGDQVITVDVEVADTPEEWEAGLSNRTELAAGNGMLFLFPQQQVLSFWMKDTLIPLDILFFGPTGKVIHTATMTPCEADPCPTYSSEKPSSIALEVPAGFLEEHSIGSDWQLALPVRN